MAKNQTNNSTNRTTNRTTDTTQKTTNRTQQKTTNRTTNTTDSKNYKGEAAARRRLMRGGLATTTRHRANCGGFSLIRPRAGPRPPSPSGEGFLLITPAYTRPTSR